MCPCGSNENWNYIHMTILSEESQESVCICMREEERLRCVECPSGENENKTRIQYNKRWIDINWVQAILEEMICAFPIVKLAPNINFYLTDSIFFSFFLPLSVSHSLSSYSIRLTSFIEQHMCLCTFVWVYYCAMRSYLMLI